jgi:hypothetical protein
MYTGFSQITLNMHQKYFLACNIVFLLSVPLWPQLFEGYGVSGERGALSNIWVHGNSNFTQNQTRHTCVYFWHINLRHQICYYMTAWSSVILEKLTGSPLIRKFPEFYETPRFITAFTIVRLLSLSWAKWVQSMCPIPLYEDTFQFNPPIYAYVF